MKLSILKKLLSIVLLSFKKIGSKLSVMNSVFFKKLRFIRVAKKEDLTKNKELNKNNFFQKKVKKSLSFVGSPFRKKVFPVLRSLFYGGKLFSRSLSFSKEFFGKSLSFVENSFSNKALSSINNYKKERSQFFSFNSLKKLISKFPLFFSRLTLTQKALSFLIIFFCFPCFSVDFTAPSGNYVLQNPNNNGTYNTSDGPQNGMNSDDTPVEQNSTDEEAGAGMSCDDAALNAQEACAGFDMASYALMSSTISSSLSSAKGSSVAKAHDANTAIQGTLGVISVSKCVKCGSAITSCKTRCSSGGDPKCMDSYGSIDPVCKQNSSQCITLKTAQAATCAQAIASLGQAYISKKAADCLRDDCDGKKEDDPPKDTPKDTPKPLIPPPMGEGNPFTFSGVTGNDGDPNLNGGGTLIKPPDDGGDGDGDDGDDDDDDDKKRPGPREPDSVSLLGGGSSNPSGTSGKYNYGKKPSSGGSGMFAGNEDEDGEDDEDSELTGANRDFSKSGKFAELADQAGGSNYRGFRNSFNNNNPGSNSLAGNRGLATNTKKDTFGKAKSGKSIFIITSQMIQNFCYGENRCPLNKKQ